MDNLLFICSNIPFLRFVKPLRIGASLCALHARRSYPITIFKVLTKAASTDSSAAIPCPRGGRTNLFFRFPFSLFDPFDLLLGFLVHIFFGYDDLNQGDRSIP